MNDLEGQQGENTRLRNQRDQSNTNLAVVTRRLEDANGACAQHMVSSKTKKDTITQLEAQVKLLEAKVALLQINPPLPTSATKVCSEAGTPAKSPEDGASNPTTPTRQQRAIMTVTESVTPRLVARRTDQLIQLVDTFENYKYQAREQIDRANAAGEGMARAIAAPDLHIDTVKCKAVDFTAYRITAIGPARTGDLSYPLEDEKAPTPSKMDEG